MWSDHDMRLLYNLLAERAPEQSISHRQMPTWAEHQDFVRSEPYLHWYFIFAREVPVGAIYLSRQREIGVSIFRAFQRRSYGRAAAQELMRRHPGRFLANVNPTNLASRRLWESLGFDLRQVTYALP
jgi:RimJ/RimL family protein N-acetyltransferase